MIKNEKQNLKFYEKFFLCCNNNCFFTAFICPWTQEAPSFDLPGIKK